MSYRVAVLGATGLVGKTLLQLLWERRFPAAEVVALASRRSAGREVPFGEGTLTVQEATAEAFAGIDLVLSSAGAGVSRELLPAAVRHGAVAVDNTSAYRMAPEIPLVVPEVNAHRIPDYVRRGVIANPNCSTIQLVVALKPLHESFGVRRVIVSTYQSVSGAGQSAVDALTSAPRHRAAGDAVTPSTAYDAVPHIDVFVDDGETREEWKMRVETPKILEVSMPLHATCVRVPIAATHGEAVWIETDRPASPAAAREVLAGAPGIVVEDDPGAGLYPFASRAAGQDPVYVGRLRRDPTHERGLAFWVVADNIRKGAALNAVQIAEGLVEHWQREGHTRPTSPPS